MSEKQGQGSSKLGFLDPLARLFRARGPEEAPAAQAEGPGRFESLGASFDAAIRGLDQKLEESRRAAQTTRQDAGPRRATAEDRAAESLRRMQEAHRAILADIEQMHARLGTELAGADLGQLAAWLEELHADSIAGRDSRSLLPRLRHAIAARLCREAGALAVERLVALLGRQQLGWPDPTRHNPTASPEEIERSRRRRLGEVRESFLAHDLERTSQRLLGVVSGWKSDYPDRGSPLWEETVLEGVAAGLRGQLVKEATELLRRDRDLLLDRAQASIGKELDAIHAALSDGVRSLEQANRAVASSLQVLDEIVPEIAWEHVRSQLPRARGERDA
jgi:hypothetical protein